MEEIVVRYSLPRENAAFQAEVCPFFRFCRCWHRSSVARPWSEGTPGGQSPLMAMTSQNKQALSKFRFARSPTATFLRRCGSGLALAALLVTAQAQAQSIRIGVVDSDRILKEANFAAATRLKLQQEFAAREKTLVDQGAALQASGDAFNRDSATLSQADRASREQTLNMRDAEFQRQRRSMQEDLDARTNEEMQRLIDRANQVVKQVAEAEHFDVVLQQAVYVSPKNDLTGKVLAILNSEAAK